jgi:M6 family metalloprotease-like protein
MKENKSTRRSLMIVSAFFVLAMASCQRGTPAVSYSSLQATSSSAGTSSVTSSEAGSSSSIVSSSSSSSTSVAPKKTLTLTLTNPTIPQGDTFFDGCMPKLILDDGTTKTDYAAYASINWKIYKGSTLTTYTPGSSLTYTGTYKATASLVKYSMSASVEFTVEKATVETASEGHGYAVAPDQTANLMKKFDEIGALGTGKMQSLGSPKLLVVPVTFEGESTFSATDIATINTSFFGDAADTGWQSLKSYYYTSSYGKLTIGGTVTSAFTYPGTSADFEASGTTDDSRADSMVNAVVTWAAGQGYNMADFDNDGDGYIDGVEMIYKTAQKAKDAGGNSLWWNFTSVAQDNTTPNKTSPVAYRYFWSMYSMIQNGFYNPNIDCHTLIHETGHMLGLDDYYSYSENKEYVAGCVDMMDCNVGDHDAYSKFAMGWAKPRIIDGSASNFYITLDSFTDTGDSLLVRDTKTDKWNNTPYDEYLLLQYYTPTGLNKKDSTGYPEWASSNGYGHGGTYAGEGLQVFHVDSRLCYEYGTYENSDGKKLTKKADIAYTDELRNETAYDETALTFKGAPWIPASNTSDYSLDVEKTEANNLSAVYSSPYRLISAITPNGTVLGSSNSMGLMSNLFGTSSDCGGALYSNFKMRSAFPNGVKFNDGSINNWMFTVDSQSDASITLHFIEN